MNREMAKISEEFLRNETAEEQIDSVIKRIYALLDERHIKFHRRGARNRLVKISLYYNVEEDAAEILRYILDVIKLEPTTLDHFWGYVVRAFQTPPFEPTKQRLARHGKKRIEEQEWRLLMRMKRSPNIIRDPDPDWLRKSLTYNSEFAKVYTLYKMEAREKLGEISTTAAKDTRYGNLGFDKPLVDIDLRALLEEIEGS
jgi:DNA-binding Lrp family transcriptional regulator